MAELIGNASVRVMAWAERILSLNHQAEIVSRPIGIRDSVFTGEFYGHRQNPDTLTVEGRGRLAHEPSHVIQQAHLQQLPQRRSANLYSSPTPARLIRSHLDAGAIMPAPDQKPALTTKSPSRVAKGQKGEKLATKISTEKRPESTPHIDIGKVADRVYHLMRHNLVLERERATRIGG